MAKKTKATMKKAAKANGSKPMKGAGKTKKALAITLLTKEPMTVDEIKKATGMSTAYVRTLLFSLGKSVKAEHRATVYRFVGETK